MNDGGNNTTGLVGHSPVSQDHMMSSSIVPEFARKLYNMLEDPSNQSIVCWGPRRDCFIVKDTNEFAKSILPQIFNHSNFASFVRQLNKYDFHKVKQTEFNQAGEQTSTFRHRDFHGDRPDDLQKIKRKLTPLKALAGTMPASLPTENPQSNEDPTSLLSNTSSSNSHPYPSSSNSNSNQSHSDDRTTPFNVWAEINHLKEENEILKGRVLQLEKNQDILKNVIDGAVDRQNEQMQVVLNLLRSMSVESHASISQGMEHTQTSTTSVMETMSSTVGVPAPTRQFLDNPTVLPDLTHLALRSQGQDIQSRVEHQGGQSHFRPGSVGIPSNRHSGHSNVQRINDFDPGKMSQATLMQTRETSRRTGASLSSSRAQQAPDRGARQWSRTDYDEDQSLVASDASPNHFRPPQRLQTISAVFVHRGDRSGVGATVDMQPISNESPGSWSFDTTILSAHGMLHGLGIGGLSHTPQTQTQTRVSEVDGMGRDSH